MLVCVCPVCLCGQQKQRLRKFPISLMNYTELSRDKDGERVKKELKRMRTRKGLLWIEMQLQGWN